MIKIGIVGGTGYTGVELLRILAAHPQAELVAITSRKEDGMPVAAMFPSLRGHVGLASKREQEGNAVGCLQGSAGDGRHLAVDCEGRNVMRAVDGQAAIPQMTHDIGGYRD